jgi:hypothetical protein
LAASIEEGGEVSELTSGEHERLKTLASRFSENWQSTANLLQEEITSLNKWVIAACLTTNGGAALAVFANESLGKHAKILAGSAFSLGSVLCIVFAMMSVRILFKAKHQTEQVSRLFHYYAIGHISDIEPIKNVEAELAKLASVGRVADYVSYGSLACFIGGVVAIGYFM